MLQMLMGKEPDGELGWFGGAGELAASVNGCENSVRASASKFSGGNAGGGSVMGGGEGGEGCGGEGSQYGFGSLDVDVGSMTGPMSTSQPSEPAEMEVLLYWLPPSFEDTWDCGF